jgi:hypothetical protein
MSNQKAILYANAEDDGDVYSALALQMAHLPMLEHVVHVVDVATAPRADLPVWLEGVPVVFLPARNEKYLGINAFVILTDIVEDVMGGLVDDAVRAAKAAEEGRAAAQRMAKALNEAMSGAPAPRAPAAPQAPMAPQSTMAPQAPPERPSEPERPAAPPPDPAASTGVPGADGVTGGAAPPVGSMGDDRFGGAEIGEDAAAALLAQRTQQSEAAAAAGGGPPRPRAPQAEGAWRTESVGNVARR